MPYLTQGEFYSEYRQLRRDDHPARELCGRCHWHAAGCRGTCVDGIGICEWRPSRCNATCQRGSTPSLLLPHDTKTIRYTQDQVHDFAWFADKRFIVRKSEVALAEERTHRDHMGALHTEERASSGTMP